VQHAANLRAFFLHAPLRAPAVCGCERASCQREWMDGDPCRAEPPRFLRRCLATNPRRQLSIRSSSSSSSECADAGLAWPRRCRHWRALGTAAASPPRLPRPQSATCSIRASARHADDRLPLVVVVQRCRGTWSLRQRHQWRAIHPRVTAGPPPRLCALFPWRYTVYIACHSFTAA